MAEGEYFPRPEAIKRKPERKERGWLPYDKVAEIFGVSTHRLRRLLNQKIIDGAKRAVMTSKGKRKKWFTTKKKAALYFFKLKPTPSEAGRRPSKPGKRERGRPAKIEKEGVVFQGA